MARYIDADELHIKMEDLYEHHLEMNNFSADGAVADCLDLLDNTPTADVVEVVRCKDCIHSQELDKHCEINRSAYRHCNIWRGEEEKNVWHSYKKYSKDYSIVELCAFCDMGERRDT